MADSVDNETRSRIMAAVKAKDTSPEWVVRRLVHSLGYRYRLHVRALPGTPDLVFPARRAIIEVRGCFWHGHSCGRCRVPATRRDYWLAKIGRNRQRDRSNLRALRQAGWSVLVVWECQTSARKRVSLENRIVRFLEKQEAP